MANYYLNDDGKLSKEKKKKKKGTDYILGDDGKIAPIKTTKAETKAKRENIAPIKKSPNSVVRRKEETPVESKMRRLNDNLYAMNDTKKDLTKRTSELYKFSQNKPVQPITKNKELEMVKTDKNFFDRVGEGAKKVGNTIAGTAGNLVMGIESTIPKAVKYIDTAKDYAVDKVTSTASKIATNIILGKDNPLNEVVSKTMATTAKGKVDEITDKTSAISGLNDTLNSEKAEKWRTETIQANTERAKKGGVVGEFANDVALGVGGNVIPMAVTYFSGGLGAGLFMTSAGGSYLEDAEQRGMEGGRALGYATGMGIVEGGTDWLINGKVLNSVAKNIAGKELLSKATLKSLGLSSLENAIQEGGTEYISEAGAELASLGTDEEYANWEGIHGRAARSALVGAVSGIIMQGAGNGIYKAAYVSNVQNNTNNAIKTAEEQLGRELTTEEQEEIKVQIKENIAKQMMDTEDLSAEEKAEIEELSKMSDEDMVSTVVERLIKNKEVDVEEVVSGVKEAMETTAQQEEVQQEQQEQTQQEEVQQEETDPMLQQAKEEANRLFEEIQQKQAEQKATDDAREVEIYQEQIRALEEERAPLLKQIEEANTEQYSEKLASLEETKEAYKDNPIVVEAIDNQIKQIKQDAKTEENEYIAPISSKEVAEQIHAENQDSLEETEAPPEQNTEFEQEEVNTRDVAIDESKVDAKSRLKDYFDLNKNETKELYSKISKANSVEQTREILEDYKDINENIEDEAVRNIKNYLRKTAIDTSNLQITDKKSVMGKAFGQIKFKKGGAKIDTVYQELSNMYPGHFSEDVINPVDQLEHIIDFVTGNTIKSKVKIGEISNEDLNGLAEELYTEVHANEFNNDAEYKNSLKDLDKVIDNAEIQSNAINEVKNKVDVLNTQISELTNAIKMITDHQKVENKALKIQEPTKTTENTAENVGLDEKIPAESGIPSETNEKIPISEVDTLLTNDITNDEKTSQNQNIEVEKTEEIKEHEKHTGFEVEQQDGGKKLEDALKNEQTKILTEMEAAKRENRLGEYLETAGIKLIDKGWTVKKEAHKLKNRTLEEDYNQIKHANREAVNMAMDGYTEWNIDTSKKRRKGRLESKKTTSSIDKILEPIKKNKATKDFYDYMYNKLNVDRMSIESKAQAKIQQMLEENPILNELSKRDTISKISQKLKDSVEQTNVDEVINKELFDKNNDLFNSATFRKEEATKLFKDIKEILKLEKATNKTLLNITAEQSLDNLQKYEGNEMFEKAYKEIRAYVDQLQNILVDGGILSEEQKTRLNEIYPNYIPAYRDVGNQIINANFFNNNIKPNDAVGKATGGTQDILPLDNSLLVKTKQVVQSARVNKYLLNLMDTYQKNNLLKVIEKQNTNGTDVMEESTSTERIGKNDRGQYTATVYKNGEKITFEISRGQYEALKPSDIPVIDTLNTLVDMKRAMLTEYNLYFATRNFLRDMPTAFLQSQDSLKWLANVPEAVYQVAKKGQYYQYAQSLGAGNNAYANENQIGHADISPINPNVNYEKNKFSKGWQAVKEWKGVKWISDVNSFIEQIPRMAEFITAVDNGKSGAGAIYAQDEVTVNFGKGGDWTKAADRNVTNFVNANIQGGYKLASTFTDAYAYGGKKGVAKVLTKYALAGASAVALMEFAWGDDEDYEELSDYIKQNYYVIGKYGDGKFIKIPKGRTNAVVESFFNAGIDVSKGDKTVTEATKDVIATIENNLAPSSLLESSIFAGIYQTLTNTSWYGEDIVPSRLQKEEAKDQYDETIDAFSIWLGQTTGLSPYKINYLLDQQTGVLGDMIIPMMTEQAETPIDNKLVETFLGQFYKDYTADSVMKNQNITDIFSLTDETSDLYVDSHKTGAKEEDVLKYKYLTSMTKKMNDLYAEKRIIQNETGLTNSEKVEALRDVQKQIDDIAKEALNNYEKADMRSNYTKIGDLEYYKNAKNEWAKLDDEEAEDLKSLSLNAKDKNTYFKTKNEISKIVSGYKEDKEDIDIDVDSDEYKELANNLSSDKKKEIATMVLDSGLDSKTKAYIYKKSYQTKAIDKIVESADSFDSYLEYEVGTAGMNEDSEKENFLKSARYTKNDKTLIYENAVLSDFDNEEKYKGYKTSKAAEIDIDTWFEYSSQEFKADKNSEGKSISGSRKDKVINFVNNSLDLTIPQKAILIKATNTFKFNDYNYDILDYVDSLNIDYDKKKKILENIDMKVDGNSVTWD